MNVSVGTVKGAIDVADFAASAIALAIKSLYQVGKSLNEWIDDHIEVLKKSVDPLIACTGRVLEGAKLGFGLGYIGATALIAAGQLLLGNPLSATVTVASSAAMMNPVAMTCAALGAIYFGWKALTEKEREQILERLSEGMSLGVELVRAFLEFAIRKFTELMDAPQLEAAKKFIKEQAAAFGRTLYDVTKQLGDFATDSAEAITLKAGQATGAIKEAAIALGDAIADRASVAGGAIKTGALKVGETVRDQVDAAGDRVKAGAERVRDLASNVGGKPLGVNESVIPFERSSPSEDQPGRAVVTHTDPDTSKS